MEKKALRMSSILPYEEATRLLTLAEKVGQSFMPAAYINDSEDSITKLEHLIKSRSIGGICFFHSRASAATNFEGAREVIYNEESLAVLKKLIARYQKAATWPLLISIDAEWGLAMRIENTFQYPYAITLGAMQEQEELVFKVGQQIGHDCRNAGIHWNFAPVADVNNNPDNPVIGYRSFGEDPVQVASYAWAFCKGLQQSGVLTSAKHFPGHGDTATDSHLGLPIIDKSRPQLFDNELIPFLELINKGVDSVMIGHLTVPVLNQGRTEAASVSRGIITDFLRGEMGFTGVVVSDALNMHAVSRSFPKKGDLERTAYLAGTDVLCYAENADEGIRSIIDHCGEEEIEEHFERVWRLKEKAWAAKEIDAKTLSYTSLMTELAEKSLSHYKGDEKLFGEFQDRGFTSFVMQPGHKSKFLTEIKDKLGEACQFVDSHELTEIENSIISEERVLLAIYPPSVKPGQNFGFLDQEIAWLEKLAENRQLIVYLFGNPYFLNLLKTELFEGIWIAYQDFPEFEKNAANHFLGKVNAEGKLPVRIKTKVK